MKWAISICLALILLFLGAAFYFNHTELKHSHYPVHSDKIYEGGWVPRIFPDDIINIKTFHFVDSHQTWVRFEKGKKEINTSSMRLLSQSEKKNLKINQPKVKWWFEGLIEQQPANDAALYAEVYEGQDGPYKTYLAIPKSGKYYYWWRD